MARFASAQSVCQRVLLHEGAFVLLQRVAGNVGKTLFFLVFSVLPGTYILRAFLLNI